MEIWKQLPNSNYLVSSIGRVKTFDAILEHTLKSGKVIKRKYVGKMLLPQTSCGYYHVTAQKKIIRIHRLVAMLFLPNPNNYPFVNHIDGVKTNNCVENLEWCTRQYNEDHAFRTGLKNSTGSHNQMAKLNEEIVYKLKYRITDKSAKNKQKLADEIGVHRATIERIWNNKIWKHV